MAWRAFQSHHLNGGEYTPETQELVIQFVNAAVYRYLGVPQTVADNLFQASSPGQYFNDKIKGRYVEMKMADGMTRGGRRSRRRF